VVLFLVLFLVLVKHSSQVRLKRGDIRMGIIQLGHTLGRCHHHHHLLQLLLLVLEEEASLVLHFLPNPLKGRIGHNRWDRWVKCLLVCTPLIPQRMGTTPIHK